MARQIDITGPTTVEHGENEIWTATVSGDGCVNNWKYDWFYKQYPPNSIDVVNMKKINTAHKSLSGDQKQYLSIYTSRRESLFSQFIFALCILFTFHISLFSPFCPLPSKPRTSLCKGSSPTVRRDRYCLEPM